MAFVEGARVAETSSTTGTGTLSLGGAISGYQAFSAELSNGDTCPAFAVDDTGAWEAFIGTYASAGNTLARTTRLDSSTGSAIDFTATKTVFLGYPGLGHTVNYSTAETTLSATDKFPFYDASAGALRHTAYSNLAEAILASPNLTGTVTLSGSTITQSATITHTRAMGTAPAGNTNPYNYLVTFTGDAGGTTDVRALRTIIEAQGSNNIADVRFRYAGVNIATSGGTTAIAYGDHGYITVSGAGNLTTGRVYYAHYTLPSTGGITSAYCYEAGDIVMAGSGTVTNSVGLRVAGIGDATKVTNAYGIQIANTSAATLVVGVDIATTSGTGKWGIRQTGNANSAIAGNLRIGSTTAPTVALDVTGAVLVSSTINKVTVTAPATSATLTLADGSSLVTSGANSITLTSTGATNVTLPTTGTLAAQSTGTFTPTLTFGGGSTGMTGSFSGRYRRTGDMVAGYVNIALTAKGSSTGNMLIGNLPFTALTGDNPPAVPYVHNMTSGVGDTHLQAVVLGNSTTARVEKITTGGLVILTHSDFTDTSIVRVSFVYFV